MIEEILHEEGPNVLRALQLEALVTSAESRQHHLGHDARGGRDQVESADASQIRLQEQEALLPVR